MSRTAPTSLPPEENGSGLVVRAQSAGQPAAGGASDSRPLPPGTERVEGAFEVFGLMVLGLILAFAVALLVMRARQRNR